jgi:hypothetical protein
MNDQDSKVLSQIKIKLYDFLSFIFANYKNILTIKLLLKNKHR